MNKEHQSLLERYKEFDEGKLTDEGQIMALMRELHASPVKKKLPEWFQKHLKELAQHEKF